MFLKVQNNSILSTNWTCKLIKFDMRERLPVEGDSGLFQTGKTDFSYMIVEKLSTVSDKGDDRLILIDSLGNISNANEYVAWIPIEKVTKQIKSSKPKEIYRLSEDANGEERKAVLLVSSSAQEEDFRDFLETNVTSTRILFNASIIAALEYHHGDELMKLKEEKRLDSDLPHLVTDFIAQNFDFFCDVKLVRPQA